MYGREPVLPPNVSLLPQHELSTSIEEHRRRIITHIEAQQLARNNIQRTKQKMKDSHRPRPRI